MWKVLFFLAMPLVPLAAANSGHEGKARDAEPQCLIRSTNVASGVELQGVAASGKPISGSYHFDVRKIGRAGTSNSVQSGEFETRLGEEVVSRVGLGLERGASYEAKLSLRWQGGEATCSARGPDRG